MKTGNDKIAHFLYSAWGTILFSGLILVITEHFEIDFAKLNAVFCGGGLMLMIGAYKEIVYDWMQGKGCPELADMAANIFGCTIGGLLILMFY